MIQDFFLNLSLQNKGFGRRLYHSIELLARNLEVKRIVAMNCKAEAIGFWEHMGFYKLMVDDEEGGEMWEGDFEKRLFF